MEAGQTVEPRQPLGQLFEAWIEPVYGYPMFNLLKRPLEERDVARRHALDYMRQRMKQCVLFIREDGQHEAWSREELEKEANPPRT